MNDLLAARSQMAISLAFHIVFAVAGMAMPILMVAAQVLARRQQDAIYAELARRWAKGTAVLFAVGAVSGTVLSFELGLLWPTFMEKAGPIIGMPFSLEGFAFFLEAIFLGLYLYGQDRLPSKVHIMCGVAVAFFGLASAVFVMSVNAWMNTPRGFTLVDGAFVDLDLWEAFFSPAFFTEALHMVFAAYCSIAFAVLGIHAWGYLQGTTPAFHLRALKIAFALALVSTPMQILSGDLAAKHLHQHQPIKLAAMEALFESQRGAPLAILGIPDVDNRKLNYALEIPYALSIMTSGKANGLVRGLSDFDPNLWPNVGVVHAAFQIMVACGFVMLAMALSGAWLWKTRNGFWNSKLFLRLCIAASPLGLVAIEAGWIVTEVGRQPFVIQGILKTRDAVTPMPHLVWPLLIFTLLYLFLAVVVILTLRAFVFHSMQTKPKPQGQPEESW